MLATLLPAATPAQLRGARQIERILRNARHARIANPRNAGLYAGALTITNAGTSQPSQTSAAATYPITPSNYGIWHITGGGQMASGTNLVLASTYAAGTNQSFAAMSRWEAMAESRYVALKLRGVNQPYRLIVDGQFVSLSPSITTTTGMEWWLLDFGTRAVRRIVIDTCGGGSVYAGAVEPAGKMWPVTTSDAVHAVLIGDSFEQGTGPSLLADAPGMHLGDWLGCYMHCSGVGGTGWAQPGASRYTFAQRLGSPVNDIALSPYAPDIVFLKASVNDRSLAPASVTAAVLAGLQQVRGNYPGIPIVVFGCAGMSYVAAVLANEAAVQAAVMQAADPLCAFAPVSTDPLGAWITGAGKAGAPANDGNSDWASSTDGTHPTDEGAAYLGRRYASAALKALTAMYTPS